MTTTSKCANCDTPGPGVWLYCDMCRDGLLELLQRRLERLAPTRSGLGGTRRGQPTRRTW